MNWMISRLDHNLSLHPKNKPEVLEAIAEGLAKSIHKASDNTLYDRNKL